MVVAPSSTSPPVRCRQIQAADLEAVADVLARGFPAKPRKYWTTALERLANRERPPGCPEFGYLLEAESRIVGVVLLIFGTVNGAVRCNISSWYVEPSHRGHAAVLAAMATKLKHVTYINTSAAAHTWPILEAQGYRRYSRGLFLAVPALSGGRGVTARALSDSAEHRALPEYELLRAHAEAGCVTAVCDTAAGPLPFVFLRRRITRAPIPTLQLVYARDTGSFVRCAGPLGRFLLTRGGPTVICDADGPIPGLVGAFFKDRGPRFFKGPTEPRPNDLAFTEMVVFGP
jgi:hypothetical protein